jgi:hypothetical protein
MRARALVAIIVLVLPAAAGCVRTTHLTSPRYEKGDADVLATAPMTGVYEVRWSDDGRTFRTLRGSQRVVADDDAIGFASGPADEVTAIVGPDRFPLQRLPPRAKYLVWRAEVRERTAIGSGIGKTLAAPITLVTGVGSLLDRQSHGTRPGERSASANDWGSQWSERERETCKAEQEKREKSNRIRQEHGLPLKPAHQCD